MIYRRANSLRGSHTSSAFFIIKGLVWVFWRASCGNGTELVLLPPGFGMLKATGADKMKANTQNILTWMIWVAAGTMYSACPSPGPFKKVVGKEKGKP